MEMEHKDREKEGAMYGSGTETSTTGAIVPEEVRKKENDLKTILGSVCENYECYASGHKQDKVRNASIIPVSHKRRWTMKQIASCN